jgi:hypothetical protein
MGLYAIIIYNMGYDGMGLYGILWMVAKNMHQAG